MLKTKNACTLILDEVQISNSIQYDVALNQFVGKVSVKFVDKTGGGNKGCFMARGITTKWKQVLG